MYKHNYLFLESVFVLSAFRFLMQHLSSVVSVIGILLEKNSIQY